MKSSHITGADFILYKYHPKQSGSLFFHWLKWDHLMRVISPPTTSTKNEGFSLQKPEVQNNTRTNLSWPPRNVEEVQLVGGVIFCSFQKKQVGTTPLVIHTLDIEANTETEVNCVWWVCFGGVHPYLRRSWMSRDIYTSYVRLTIESFLSYLEDHPRTCKWLGSPPFISHKFRPFGRGPTTRSLGDLLLTIVANFLLTRMILQVRCAIFNNTTSFF